MVNTHTAVVAALQDIGLPVIYELVLDSSAQLPCISYMETNNAALADGTTLRYSSVTYMVKVWARDLQTALQYRAAIDTAMYGLGFTRTSTETLGDGNEIILQCVMFYDAKTTEEAI